MAGASIYLVSACSSGEEFVAAFRRYADRTGLFIPVSDPLTAGRRLRIALTLKNGGVMIEGEAEVIASSPKPSALHGRIGMTIRFVEPDAPSKIVLGELEKARLAMKPAPPSVPPRPADIPAAPRPVPPAPGGRIDVNNALAECVMIGESGGGAQPAAEIATAPPKASQKFVAPAGERAKTPSTAPQPKPEASVAPKPTLVGVAPLDKPAPPMLGVAPKTVVTPAPKDTVPGTAAPTRADATPAPKDTVPGTQAPKDTVPGTTPARRDPTPPAQRTTAMGPGVAGPSSGDAARTAPTGNEGRSRPGAPRFPTPVAPLPVTRLPAQPAPPIVSKPMVMPIAEIDLAEPTDLVAIPSDPNLRTTSVGEAVDPTLDSPIETPDAAAPATEPIAPKRVSQILAAIPSSGDWTMTPDALEPTVLPSSEKVAIPDPTPAPGPAPGPAGDWTISLAPGAEAAEPPAWAAPPPAAPKPKSGNPMMAVASEAPLSAKAAEDRPVVDESKVEVDPTLMEPLKPMPIFEDTDNDDAEQLAPPPMPSLPGPPAGQDWNDSSSGGSRMPPPPLAPMPMPMHVPMDLARGPLPHSYVTPPHGSAPIAMSPQTMPSNASPPQAMMGFPPPPSRMVTDGGAGFFINDSGQLPRYPSEAGAIYDPARKRKRTMLIIGGAAFVALIVTVIALVGGGDHKKPGHGRGSAAAIVTPGSGSSVEIAAGSGSAHATPIDAGVAAPKICKVELTTVPAGVEVTLDATKDQLLGTTPKTFELPCDVETKLYLRKVKYNSTVKAVTATADTAKVTVRLQKPTFALKVTSSPSGATITLGGKSLGVTPTTIKVPAFDSTSITLSKDGYSPDTQKVAVRQNNIALHVVLKKVGPKKLH